MSDELSLVCAECDQRPAMCRCPASVRQAAPLVTPPFRALRAIVTAHGKSTIPLAGHRLPTADPNPPKDVA